MKRGHRGLAKLFTTTLFTGIIGLPPDCDSPLLDPLERFGGQDFGDTIFGGYEDPTGITSDVAGSYARDAVAGGYSSNTPLENILGAPDSNTTTFTGGSGMGLTL